MKFNIIQSNLMTQPGMEPTTCHKTTELLSSRFWYNDSTCTRTICTNTTTPIPIVYVCLWQQFVTFVFVLQCNLFSKVMRRNVVQITGHLWEKKIKVILQYVIIWLNTQHQYMYFTPARHKRCYWCVPSLYRPIAPCSCCRWCLNPLLQSLLLAALSFDQV